MARATPAAGPILPPALRDPLIVLDDFLPAELAEVMRLSLDDHFAQAEDRRPDQPIWDFRFKHERHAFLSAAPEKVLQHSNLLDFHERLRAWSLDALGLAQVSWPHLNLFVGGCREGLNNEARGGRFGFTYSLTRNQRRTSGGETIIHREGDPVRDPAAGLSLFDTVEPRFNRLIVYDRRAPRMIERVEGSMDPREGLLVLQGQLSESGPIVAGALAADAVVPAAAEVVRAFVENAFLDGYHGVIVLRLDVEPGGVVGSCRLLLDRVLHPSSEDRRWPGLAGDLIARFAALRFAEAAGPSVVIVPLSFGPQTSSA